MEGLRKRFEEFKHMYACHADFYSVLGLHQFSHSCYSAVESCVLLKHMGKYHIVCENQRGTSLKICNLDSIPGLLQTPVNLLICVCLNFLYMYIELTLSPPLTGIL